MKTFLLGLIIGLILIPAAVYVYFAFGLAPVATAAQAMPFEKMLAKKALHARVEKEMPKNVPIAADENSYVAGAKTYREQCAVCHGLPGQRKTGIANGMYPKPPALLEGTGVTDDPPGETYWKVAGGIRMTGMPSFSATLSPTQMWQVSVLCADADKLPVSAKQILAAPLPTVALATTSPK